MFGRFTPLTQFLAVGCTEALRPWPIEFIAQNDRSDRYRQIFGNAQQEVQQNLWHFTIGAGALGCEQQKSWVMMRFATKGSGRIWLTDMARIERSNLNPQFLF
jgi:ubiquitin-activating enzyme E1